MTTMKIIESGLWPHPARKAAREHNCKYHGCRATAYIFVDRTTKAQGLPTYEVICPVCPAEEQASMELGS